MTIRFEQARTGCIDVLRALSPGLLADTGGAVLVRDLFGRIRLAVRRSPADARLQPILDALSAAAGPFWSGRVLAGESMVAPEAVFDSPDAIELEPGLSLLERVAAGAEWARPPLRNRSPQPPRATVYGLKGGVGRSTTLCVWARHLAEQGRKVLVVDLDLESPGVSSLLLPSEATPDFGIVDWFVEDAVDNADTELLRLMVAPSPLAAETRGQVLVAPCYGTAGDDYLPKLARTYVDLPGSRPRAFAERVAELIDQLEEEHVPDVVLLDSRAGLHDLAAIATTRLDAMTFLFAAGTRQTWDGYRMLLHSWAKQPDIARGVRERLRVVAAQIPETERDAYLENFRQAAYDVFAVCTFTTTRSANRSGSRWRPHCGSSASSAPTRAAGRPGGSYLRSWPGTCGGFGGGSRGPRCRLAWPLIRPQCR